MLLCMVSECTRPGSVPGPPAELGPDPRPRSEALGQEAQLAPGARDVTSRRTGASSPAASHRARLRGVCPSRGVGAVRPATPPSSTPTPWSSSPRGPRGLRGPRGPASRQRPEALTYSTHW